MDVTGECLEYDEFMLHNHEVRSTSLRRRFTLAALWAMLLALVTLVACVGIPVVVPAASPAPVVVVMLGTPVDMVDQDTQGTLIALLTQQQNNTDIQAAATAAILQANHLRRSQGHHLDRLVQRHCYLFGEQECAVQKAGRHIVRSQRI